jgi:ABC-2 type transport system permease protein
MIRALRVERIKFQRSPVVLVSTPLMVLLLPAIGIGMFSIASTDVAGPLAAKVQGLLFGEGWTAYLGVISQIAAAAVFVGAGVVAAWAFGREHSDRTFSSLFALAVPRSAIASAKFVVLVVWAVCLTVSVAAASLVAGALGGVGELSLTGTGPPLVRLAFVVATTALLALAAGYVASIGRGYLPAIGVIVVVVAIAQISVLFGAGGWFPFAVPGLVAISGSEAAPALNAFQLALVPAVVVTVVWLTIEWWRKAEVV